MALLLSWAAPRWRAAAGVPETSGSNASAAASPARAVPRRLSGRRLPARLAAPASHTRPQPRLAGTVACAAARGRKRADASAPLDSAVASRRPPPTPTTSSSRTSDAEEEEGARADAEAEPAPRYERQPVKLEAQNKSLRDLVRDVDEGRLNLEPEFQRDFVWNSKKCNGLLKTVFEGLAVPAIMLFKRYVPGQGEVWDVVDGKQRLVTLYAFFTGDEKRRFPKAPTRISLDPKEDELGYLLDGKRFVDLSKEDQNHIGNYTVQVQMIPQDTPLRLVFRIYENINAGGANHSHQQLRRAAFHGPYIQLLGRLADPTKEPGKTFHELAGLSEEERSAQLGEELVLRFFALRRAAIPSNKRRFRTPMKTFLNDELQAVGPDARMKDLWLPTPAEQEQMEEVFEATVAAVASLRLREAAEQVLPKGRGFRKSGASVSAVWDATLVGVSLALDENSNLGVYERNADRLRRLFKELLASGSWEAAGSALSHKSLTARVRAFRELVVERGLQGDPKKLPRTEPRAFGRADKEALFAQAAATSAAPGSAAALACAAGPAAAAIAPAAAAVAAAAAPASGSGLVFAQPAAAASVGAAPQNQQSARVVCDWCGNPIVDPAHAEVDHIVPYAHGGATARSNARLLHRLCNRERGTRPMSEGPAARRAAAGGAREG